MERWLETTVFGEPVPSLPHTAGGIVPPDHRRIRRGPPEQPHGTRDSELQSLCRHATMPRNLRPKGGIPTHGERPLSSNLEREVRR
jgi:hypothetical protein